jgi:hypothetical protein
VSEKEEPGKDKIPQNSEHQVHPLHPSWRNPWVVLAGVLIVAFILLCAGSFDLSKTYTIHAGYGSRGLISAGPGGGITKGMGFSRSGTGGFVYSSNANLVSGVVTAVNGSTLTVAGDGSTSSVDTTSSTSYTNAPSAVVNDTVIATGSTSGGTFTATRIIVNP